MARVLVSGDDDPDIYYVVDGSVGPNCTNRTRLRLLQTTIPRRYPTEPMRLCVVEQSAVTALTGRLDSCR